MRTLGPAAALVLLLLAVTVSHAATLSEVEHAYQGGKAAAYRIENRFFSLVVVPERGGRVAEWIDKRVGDDVILLKPATSAHGGLLDDHEALAAVPYTAEVLARGPDRVALRMTGTTDEEVQYVKTLTVYEDRPVLEVSYELSNPSDNVVRALFRNVVRPGGGVTSEDDLYCYPTTAGIVHSVKGFGRTDNIGAPWMAYVNQPRARAISTVFEGDVLRRFYSWNGGAESPTYEFMFENLQPGQRYGFTYYWQLTHGLAAIDDATRQLLMRVEPGVEEGRLTTQVSLNAVWDELEGVTVTQRWLTPNREPVGPAQRQAIGRLAIDAPTQVRFDGPAVPDEAGYAIAELVVEADGKELARTEKPLVLRGDQTPGYERQLVWHGQTEIGTIPGWEPVVPYEVVLDEADRARGYVLYEPFGEAAGQRVERITVPMGMDEPETLPIFVHAVRDLGEVVVSVERPDGVPAEAVNLFRGEVAPYVDWGRERFGWKLPVADRFTPAVGEESSFWVRIDTRGWDPGHYSLPITFRPERAEPQTVELVVEVHPVAFPQRPSFTINAVTLLNFMCSTGTGFNREWDFARGLPYLRDLQAHGNVVMASYGQNSLTGGGWGTVIKKATLRDSGVTLAEAIAADPDRFRSESLPDLDLGYWTPLFDLSIQHGFRVYRTTLGSPGKVREAFLPISRRIWDDKDLAADDPRHVVVHRWMYEQIVRYLKDRGYRQLLANIGDEIPSDKYEAWIADAAWAQELGFHPGLTQSNVLLTNEEHLRRLLPVYPYPIIGEINKDLLHRRLREGLLQPLRLETYDAVANYWKQYDYERRRTGWLPGYLELDGCWIQTYYRWKQGEAIIFPTDDGPITTAAWEGVRDGYDDANYYQVALALIERLAGRNAAAAEAYRKELDGVVSRSESALVQVTLKKNRLGDIDQIADAGVDAMRAGKRRLLELITALRQELPPQRPTLRYGDLILSDRGAEQFKLIHAAGQTAARERLADELRRLDPELRLDAAGAPHRVVLATLDHLPVEQVPALRAMTTDLNERYPGEGGYVIRSETGADGSRLIALIGGDGVGLEKAVSHWAVFLEHEAGDETPRPAVAGPAR